jgi:hypothetical protein
MEVDRRTLAGVLLFVFVCLLVGWVWPWMIR